MANATLKRPGGKYLESNFLPVCLHFADQNYPGWRGLRSNEHIFPPIFQPTFSGPLDSAASGYVAIPSGTLTKRRGDEAEQELHELVIEVFRGAAERPIAIFSADYAPFRNLSTDYPSLKSVSTLPAEIIDIELFSVNSIILIEVKAINPEASEDSKADAVQKALKQLNKAENFYRTLMLEILEKSHELSPGEIIIKKILFLPCMPGDSGADLCKSQKVYQNNITPCFKEDKTVSRFRENFNQWISYSSTANPLPWEALVAICLTMKHCLSWQVRLDTFQRISMQTYLEANYKQFSSAKKGMTDLESDPVVKIKRSQLLAQQFLFLNNEQARSWFGPTKQYFGGTFGTGKTLLIQHRILDRVKLHNESCVIFVQLATVGQLYRDFCTLYQLPAALSFDDPNYGSVSEGIVRIITLPESEPELLHLSETLSNFLAQSATVNVFTDEVQFMGTFLMTALLCKLDQHKERINYCWFADYLTNYLLGNNFELTTVGHFEKIRQLQLDDLSTTIGTKFHLSCLWTHLRCSTRVFSFLREKKLIPEGKYTIGHNVPGPVLDPPAEFQLAQRSCELFNQQTLTEIDTSILCVVERVLREWCNWSPESPTHGDPDFRRLAIVLTFGSSEEAGRRQRWMHLLSKKFPTVPFTCEPSLIANSLVVLQQREVLSWEWPAVLCIHELDANSWSSVSFARCVPNCWAAICCSRAVTQLYYIEIQSVPECLQINVPSMIDFQSLLATKTDQN